MCLGVPGQVVAVEQGELGMTMGTVSFGGVQKQVCLAYVPEVGEGDWVLVHVGFALSQIDEEEAKAVFALLREMGDLDELEGPADGSG
jgi:hydrogenase expression/formation protein HypC